MTLESRVNEFVREAEASRARVVERTGNELDFVTPNQFMKKAMMDENYLIVAAHVDENMERRIRNGDYIDFSSSKSMKGRHKLSWFIRNCFQT